MAFRRKAERHPLLLLMLTCGDRHLPFCSPSQRYRIRAAPQPGERTDEEYLKTGLEKDPVLAKHWNAGGMKGGARVVRTDSPESSLVSDMLNIRAEAY
jgi:hypothetical protein